MKRETIMELCFVFGFIGVLTAAFLNHYVLGIFAISIMSLWVAYVIYEVKKGGR